MALSDALTAGRRPHRPAFPDLATFGEEDVYDQKDAVGFINLFGLPLKVRALVERQR